MICGKDLTVIGAAAILSDLKCPFVINQNSYNIFNRTIEKNGLKKAAKEKGKGIICFSPLAQGMLSNRYLNGIPKDSRAAKNHFLQSSSITEEKLCMIRRLDEIAQSRGQSLAQMALSWVLRENKVTTVLIGASRKEQIIDNVKIVEHLDFTADELAAIEGILAPDEERASCTGC